MTPLVQLTHVSKQYDGGDRAALSDVDLEIAAGDCIALMGQSGSGKSTLLNLIAALDAPTDGQVTWSGRTTPLAPGEIGTAFQSAGLIPWLSVEENVRLPLLLSDTKRPGNPTALLTRLGVGDLARKLPDELSGGQAQRVGLARAMVTTPAVLLADEPFGQLDHQIADHVIETLKRWASENHVALVVATHDPEIAERMHRQWKLDHGKMSEIVQ